MNFLSGGHASNYGADTIGIRPEHLKIMDDGNLNAVVRTVEHLGNEAFVHAQMSDGTMLTVRTPDVVDRRPDQPISFTAQSHHVHRFNPSGQTIAL